MATRQLTYKLHMSLGRWRLRTVALVDGCRVAGRGSIAGRLRVLVGVGLIDIAGARGYVCGTLPRVSDDRARVVDLGRLRVVERVLISFWVVFFGGQKLAA